MIELVIHELILHKWIIQNDRAYDDSVLDEELKGKMKSHQWHQLLSLCSSDAFQPKRGKKNN